LLKLLLLLLLSCCWRHLWHWVSPPPHLWKRLLHLRRWCLLWRSCCHLLLLVLLLLLLLWVSGWVHAAHVPKAHPEASHT